MTGPAELVHWQQKS